MNVPDRLDAHERDLLRQQDRPSWSPPMLATLTDDRFTDDAWIFERKLDGERALALCTEGLVELRSRNRQDLSGTYPEIVTALQREQPAASQFALDGEVVAFHGSITSFARLQGRLGITDPERARASGIAVFYYIFDLLHLDGYDTTGLPLRRRKSLLRVSIGWQDPLRFTPHRNRSGEAYYRTACSKGWEGVIAKRADSAYRHSRSGDWLKFKCMHQQELVIGGHTDPHGSRTGFGALLLGYYDDGDLVYAGKVGTGFDDEALHRLGAALRDRHRADCPFDRGGPPPAHWADPDLVCEVGFTEWTGGGRLRHPRYLGLRHDKDPADVRRERPRSASA